MSNLITSNPPSNTSPFYTIVLHPVFVCSMCDMRYDTFESIEHHLKEGHKITKRIAPPPAVPR